MHNLSRIANDYQSFQELILFYEKFKDTSFENISLNINDFFAANMSAVLAGLLEKLELELNSISLTVTHQRTKEILQKNEFLTYYGFNLLTDTNNTTIAFKKFGRTESKSFTHYIMTELMPRKGMPTMSDNLKIEISIAINEIFANSSMHTSTSFIFACGQFFPKKNVLDFTIVDIGGGIKNKVNEFLQENKNATDAIKWALIDGNTTKRDAPGGYGLSILKNLIALNKGFMQIVSNEGFYEYTNGGRETYKLFQGEFPGTVINLQFKTDDTSSYSLKSETE